MKSRSILVAFIWTLCWRPAEPQSWNTLPQHTFELKHSPEDLRWGSHEHFHLVCNFKFTWDTERYETLTVESIVIEKRDGTNFEIVAEVTRTRQATIYSWYSFTPDSVSGTTRPLELSRLKVTWSETSTRLRGLYICIVTLRDPYDVLFYANETLKVQ